jgi:hypothetical protein
MAYEDLVEAAKLGTTVIDGGYIKADLLTADNVVAGTFTGLKFQTAASGQRAVIDTDNTFKLYDSSGNVVILINDDANGYAVIGSGSSFTKLGDGFINVGSAAYVSQISSLTETGDILLIKGYPRGIASENVLNVKGNLVNVGASGNGVNLQVLGGDIKIVANTNGLYVGNNKVIGAQQSAISAPSGGGTQDAEARTAIGSILTAMRTHGLIAT